MFINFILISVNLIPVIGQAKVEVVSTGVSPLCDNSTLNVEAR